ncbi:MAG: hypothetical protein OEV24_03940, partial [Cyclobacteriaceae bacterium]|nr:hypothetical protein [Cyclobacteriaceae bacterium]
YLKTFEKVFPVNFKVAYSAAAIPSRIALENRNWTSAARLQFPSVEIDWNAFPWEKSILHFARAIGSVRSGDIQSSESELAILRSLHQELLDMGDEYKANQVQIQINATQAWIHFANDKSEYAVSLMKEAARMENNTSKHPVTPGEVLPAGELLGDLLLSMDRPAEALKEYEYDLQQHPNRFNGLYGAAIAAKEIGDKMKATHYFELLLSLTKNSNSDRQEIKEARAYIGQMQ